ncbi:MAG: DUF5908 family protein [Cyclobacteriaceae bacterium]
MSIKVNEFVIQAKIIEDDTNPNSSSEVDIELPKSLKKEIIDECMEKMKEYLDRERARV